MHAQEMEKVGGAPFVVVYFNADAELGVLPSNSFFLDVHCALHPGHRRQLRVRAALCQCSPCHAALAYMQQSLAHALWVGLGRPLQVRGFLLPPAQCMHAAITCCFQA